jgi:hypothetical protein
MQNSKETERLLSCEYRHTPSRVRDRSGNIARFVRHDDPTLVAGSSDRQSKVGGPHPSVYSSMSSRSSWMPSKARIGRRWSAR